MTGSWAEKVVARMGHSSSASSDEPAATEEPRPAWALVAAARAAGRVPAPEVLAEAQRTGRRPRTEFERKLLDRLGYGDVPPAA